MQRVSARGTRTDLVTGTSEYIAATGIASAGMLDHHRREGRGIERRLWAANPVVDEAGARRTARIAMQNLTGWLDEDMVRARLQIGVSK